MIHEHSDVTGLITVTLEAEDWIWLCKLLNQTIKELGDNKETVEDTEHLLNVLQDVTRV